VTEQKNMTDGQGNDGGSKKTPTLRCHYIKSNFYRVVSADGCFGGRQPRGQFQLSFFSERLPIPQIVEHEIKSTRGAMTEMGDPVGQVSREGIVREVEVGVAMTVGVARALHKWIGDQLKVIEGEDKEQKEFVDGES